MIIKYLKSDKGRFIVRNGIVKYGLPSGITMAILYELMNVEFKLSAFNIKNIFTLYTIIFIIFFIIGGYFFGYILWHIMDLKRKKDLR